MVVVHTMIKNPSSPSRGDISGFVENKGYVSIEAVNYTRAVETSNITWQVIPNL